MASKPIWAKLTTDFEWSFIRAVLGRFGFATHWTDLIMACISSVSYSFLINDAVCGNVVPMRGIRQGDPLSPYIFILCGKVLSGLCKRAQASRNLTGLRAGRLGPRIIHLLFADDTMFFLKTDQASIASLSDIIRQYEASSGQMISASKSSISFSAKTPQETRSHVLNYLGISREGGVGKYLGLPEHFGRRKKDLFTSIVDQIRQKARSWPSRRLSRTCKLTMLKSVLSAIPSYAMTCFLLPMSLCKRNQSALTRFWWDADENTKKMCWGLLGQNNQTKS